MKLIAEPIEAITWTSKQGDVRPIRFQWEHAQKRQVVKIDRILKVERTKKAGESALVFTCESVIAQEQRLYELRYTLSNCTWVLYKI